MEQSNYISASLKLLTRKEAAKLLGCNEGTLATWKYNKRYDLPCIKIGKNVRYKYSDIMEFIERNTKI